jgi:hypothetical protein
LRDGGEERESERERSEKCGIVMFRQIMPLNVANDTLRGWESELVINLRLERKKKKKLFSMFRHSITYISHLHFNTLAAGKQ